MALGTKALSPYALDLLARSMAWMDHLWDENAGLLWSPGDVSNMMVSRHAEDHMVRETIWYALGLLMRSDSGDTERALQAISAVLDNQFDQPGKVYHGTFRRAPEEPHPPEFPIEWKD